MIAEVERRHLQAVTSNLKSGDVRPERRTVADRFDEAEVFTGVDNRRREGQRRVARPGHRKHRTAQGFAVLQPADIGGRSRRSDETAAEHRLIAFVDR